MDILVALYFFEADCQKRELNFYWGDVTSIQTWYGSKFIVFCRMVPRTFLFIFNADSRRLGSNNFRNSSDKDKTAVFPYYLSISYTIMMTAMSDTRFFTTQLKVFEICIA